MAVTGTVESTGHRYINRGDAGVDDEDVVIETGDISELDLFHVSCGAGSFDVFVNDGVQWLTVPLSLTDLGATGLDPVVAGTALRAYGFRGFWSKIRIQQTGATALTGCVLRGTRLNN